MWTQWLDRVLSLVRDYFPPLHWCGAAATAYLVLLYAKLVSFTIRLTLSNLEAFPIVSGPRILTIWHGCAPSFLVAMATRPPWRTLTVMVARDPRGDFLAVLCRLLGLRVVRGDAAHDLRVALAELVSEIKKERDVLITADGGGPRRIAKPGAVLLSALSHAPVVAVGADCRPAIVQSHKWDKARNPVPFGRVVVVMGHSRRFPVLDTESSLDRGREWLQAALEHVTAAVRRECQD